MDDKDILAGVEQVGIWPGQSLEYRWDDWEVGYRDRRGKQHKLVRVHNADRDKAYAHYLLLHKHDDDDSTPYIQRGDGASWPRP
jgi:hypothetical protein